MGSMSFGPTKIILTVPHRSYVHVCSCVYIHTFMYIYMHVCMYACIYIFVCVSKCAPLHVWIYVYTHIYIYVYIYLFHLFAYTYIYTYVDMRTYVYIHICYSPHEPHAGPFHTVNTNRNCHFLVTILRHRFFSIFEVLGLLEVHPSKTE